MRKMQSVRNPKIILKIVRHLILSNGWEYYITNHYKQQSDIQEALVMGQETELGDFSLSEALPYMVSSTDSLNEVIPAEGYRWVE